MGVGSIVISSAWAESVKAALASVRSSGQAWAAIDAAYAFAAEVRDAVESQAGGSFSVAALFSSGDALLEASFAASAAKDLDNAALAITRLKGTYGESSETPVNRSQWARDSEKILYVYNLAQVTRQGYPPNVDTDTIDAVMAGGPNTLVSTILDAPEAVINYTADLSVQAIDAAGRVGGKAVSVLGDLGKGLASAVKDTAEAAIPWTPVLFVVGLAVLGVGSIYFLSKAGVGIPGLKVAA